MVPSNKMSVLILLELILFKYNIRNNIKTQLPVHLTSNPVILNQRKCGVKIFFLIL